MNIIHSGHSGSRIVADIPHPAHRAGGCERCGEITQSPQLVFSKRQQHPVSGRWMKFCTAFCQRKWNEGDTRGAPFAGCMAEAK